MRAISWRDRDCERLLLLDYHTRQVNFYSLGDTIHSSGWHGAGKLAGETFTGRLCWKGNTEQLREFSLV